MKHTSGPWYRSGNRLMKIVDARAESEIASVHTEADARLIASAPDLLAFVKWYKTFCEVKEPPADGYPGYSSAVELISRAEWRPEEL